MRSLLLLAMLILTACGAVPPDVYDTRTITDARERSLLEQAGDDWCQATEGAFCPRFDGGDGDNRIKMVDADRPRDWCGATDVPTWAGWDEPWKPVSVWIARSDSDEAVKHRFRHELAHAATRFHSHLPDGNTMAVNESGSPGYLTAADVDYVVRGL